MKLKSVVLLLVCTVLLGTGCSIVHLTPLAAREGDTVMVAVGSPDDLAESNITSITYTPTGGSPINISTSQVRAVFNLYPSKQSEAWLYSNALLIENESYHGPWTSIIALDLPTGGILPVGTGNLQVSTTANFNGTIPGVNGKDLALEILPTTATSPQPSTYDFLGFGGIQQPGDLKKLESMPRLEFRPPYTGYDNTNTYGAAEITISMNKTGISEDDFNIIVDDKIGPNQTRNVHSSWSAKDLTTTVYFISPTGELQYSDVNFSIISSTLLTLYGGGIFTIPTNADVTTTWYDINGNVISGPAVNIVNLTGF